MSTHEKPNNRDFSFPMTWNFVQNHAFEDKQKSTETFSDYETATFDVAAFKTENLPDYDPSPVDEEELYYKLANLPSSDIKALIAQSKPIDQAKYLSVLLHHAIDAGYYDFGGGKLDPLDTSGIFQMIKNTPDQKVAPLIKIFAEDFELYIEQPNTGNGTVGYYEEYSPQPSYNIDTSGLDQESTYLLEVIYDDSFPDIKPLIEQKIGNIDLANLSIDAQVQLLKYMTEADSKRFNYLSQTMQEIDSDLRPILAESYLAANFGEDFGDALLDIANSKILNTEQVKEILLKINKCRESISGIASMFDNFDNGIFSSQYSRAANERLTDALTVFRQIAKDGTAKADLDWAGRPEFTFDSAMEALSYETKSLEVINGTLQDISTGKNGAFIELILKPDRDSAKNNRSVYNLYSPDYGYTLLYTRPEGSHSFNPALEYGKKRSRYVFESNNAGVEASISFITNPADPFSLPNPFRPGNRLRQDDPAKLNKVSAIRLDREGRTLKMPPDDPNRDAVNPEGICSIDLAAIGDSADTPSGKIARLLSVGGEIRAETNGTESSLNHNTKWFNQAQYGSAEGFYKLVAYIDGIVTDWCNEHSPDKNDTHSFAYRTKLTMGQQTRRISKKIA
ncbi:MAG: hypothetical protein K5837_04235 [Candidatus Saccharibacteria bacterium]|nr:hypothetical protein [Candidatus Saccharibacteria bacterium]